VIPDTLRPLVDRLARTDGLIVAFSGGVDSSVVAAAAQIALGTRAVAVTAMSPSVASWQLDMARRVAVEIGIHHEIIATHECDRPDYQRNDSERCFYCKSTLYESLESIRQRYGSNHCIASGTNADDLGDYRPGLKAGHTKGILTPLADLGWGKTQVREAATILHLSNARLPASPCLASRIAYGVPVTPQRLAKVEAAEALIREHGFSVLRVRLLHEDDCDENDCDVARIEVEASQLQRLDEIRQTDSLDNKILSIGFTKVIVDRTGFRSGKMNDALPILHT
jgi:pyridinium-3,5-biscarboxylic acid mononucleotide sulfurtransferase